MRRCSLKLRLGLGMAAMLAVTVVMLSLSAYLEFQESLFDLLDRSLGSQAKAIEATISSAKTSSDLNEEIQSLLGQVSGSKGPVYRIWIEGQAKDFDLSSHEVWPLNWSWLAEKAPPPGQSKFFNVLNIQRNDRSYRLLWERVIFPGQGLSAERILNIVIANYCGDINNAIDSFVKLSFLVGGFVLLSSIIFTLLMLYWGFKPVKQITDQMNRITGKNLSDLSLYMPASLPELEPFVRSWNQMIERLVLAMKQQQRFTADAAHELRTPLAIAKSTLQAARSSQRTGEKYETAIDKSLEDLARLEHLSEQLLTLAHLDDISGPSDWQDINLRELIIEVCEKYLPLAAQHAANLQWQLCEASIRGDTEQIMRMLGNLIDNAIKHGPAGGEILVSLQTVGEFIKISVHDQGGQIAPEEWQLIFDRFHRIHKSRDRSAGGSGLGLAIAQEIARRHKGEITLHSSPESGTNFVVMLPSNPQI